MSTSIPPSAPIAITGPLTIAELLDRTFRALRARFGVLILSAAIVMVPLGVLTALLTGRYMTSYFEVLQYSFDDPENAEMVMQNFAGELLGFFAAIAIISVLSVVGTSLVSLITTFHIDRFLHGLPAKVGDGWRVAGRRILPLIGMQILEFLVIGFVTAGAALVIFMVIAIFAIVFAGAMTALGDSAASVILIVGIVILVIVGYLALIVLMLAPALYFGARWSVAAPSLLLEDLGPVAALRRSWMLTKGRAWRSILYLLLLSLIGFFVVSLPVGVTQQITMLLMPSQMGLIAVLSTVAGYVLNLLYQPFYSTGIVLFYYDQRVRAEAYDVALRVEALETEVAANAPPA